MGKWAGWDAYRDRGLGLTWEGLGMKGRSAVGVTRGYLEALAVTERMPGAISDELYDRLIAYHKFVEREGHLLEKFPGELFTILHNQPEDSAVYAEDGTLGPNPRPGRAWLKRLNPHRPTRTRPWCVRSMSDRR